MSNRTALVVDDSKSARFAMRKLLENFNFHVETAESAEDAFIFLRKQLPSVVFIDHVMPGTDGFEAIRVIRGDVRYGGLPIVLCSSNEGPEFLREARANGANDVLQKPPSPDKFKSLLDNLPAVPETTEPTQAAAVPPATPAVPPPAPPAVTVVPSIVQAAPPAPPAAGPSSGKVQPIREPEVAIEQAVMKNLREAWPPSARPAAADAPAAPVLRSVPAREDLTARLDGMRDEVEARMRKITQDLFVQIAELKAQLAHIEAAQPSRDDERLLSIAGEVAERQMDAVSQHFESTIGQVRTEINQHVRAGDEQLRSLNQRLESSTARLRVDIDEQTRTLAEQLRAQDQRIEQLSKTLREAVVEEAHSVSERLVMSAAARISEQIAESLLRVLKPASAQR
jgi:CheY-like chemotaxis protein